MTEAVLDVVDVVKRRGHGAGEVQALKGVSLSLNGGELVLLMGPSGSGKTTLLSVMGCLMTPTRGTVRVRGRSIAGAGPEDLAKLRRDHIGFIFQSYHLFPTLTAEDNVRLALDVRGQRSRRAKIAARESLAMVGLSHKTKAFPIELSGGEQQRVAIARAFAAQPQLILADEPTGSLDKGTGQKIVELLREAASTQRATVLVVTHDEKIAQQADRRLELDDGVLKEIA
jgi:putative ABC transport system ATP-binding protein